MSRHRWNWMTLVTVMAVMLAQTPMAQKIEPPANSTVEERAKAVHLARQLEANPLAAEAKTSREWLNKWLARIPDVQVEVCFDMLGNFGFEKNKYQTEIAYQMMYGSAVFIIENPGRAADRVAKFQAGIRSALKVYQYILARDGQARSKSLDIILLIQNGDDLDRFINATIPKCK